MPGCRHGTPPKQGQQYIACRRHKSYMRLMYLHANVLLFMSVIDVMDLPLCDKRATSDCTVLAAGLLVQRFCFTSNTRDVLCRSWSRTHSSTLAQHRTRKSSIWRLVPSSRRRRRLVTHKTLFASFSIVNLIGHLMFKGARARIRFMTLLLISTNMYVNIERSEL